MGRSLINDQTNDLRDPKYAAIYGAELAKSEFGITLARARNQAGLSQKN